MQANQQVRKKQRINSFETLPTTTSAIIILPAKKGATYCNSQWNEIKY